MGHLKGLSIAKGAPVISHLLFADDSLLFCQATEDSCQAVNRVLDHYHRASGQLLNTEKTVMSFSPNATQGIRDRFHNVLGIPSYAGKDKKELFSGIKDRIWKLMNQLHAKLFSIGGREVLLKVVVQSIPTYDMSCFSLPNKFCNQLESIMANFWCGSNTNNSKILWKKWKFMCSKADGGMGFRSFIHFNQDLLAKQAWRILDIPDSLLARVFKARYFKNGDFLSAQKGTLPSLTWQSICDGKKLLLKGLRWKIGTWKNVRCATDPWLPGNTSFTPYYYGGDPLFTIEHYISLNWQWDTFPQKSQIFAWRLINDALPTSVNLAHRKITSSTACARCKCSWESVLIFFSHVAAAHNDTDLELITCLMWCIWSERNKEIHGTKPKSADIIHTFAASHLAQYHKATSQQPAATGAKFNNSNSQAHQGSPHAKTRPKWHPPEAGCFKLNVDAACDNAGAVIGFGALIRGHYGNVIAGLSKPFRGCFSPKEMEAAAFFPSVNWAIQHQLPIHIIETDALVVVNALNKTSSTRFVIPFYDLVDDISYLLFYFPGAKVSHAKKDANEAAHALAKFALRLDEDKILLGEIPSPISSVVINDSIF
ncbi:uncharacterized protein LOC133032110 [Cannabis sativa]|nr:uncharacterized protein LOC133032110 [Cannabis sativa]